MYQIPSACGPLAAGGPPYELQRTFWEPISMSRLMGFGVLSEMRSATRSQSSEIQTDSGSPVASPW